MDERLAIVLVISVDVYEIVELRRWRGSLSFCIDCEEWVIE